LPYTYRLSVPLSISYIIYCTCTVRKPCMNPMLERGAGPDVVGSEFPTPTMFISAPLLATSKIDWFFTVQKCYY
jgi:hypothetical protein